MSVEQCFMGVCFIPLDADAPKLFGFPELLAGLALMVLSWTIADVRYRFRIKTAPMPLQNFTFGIVTVVGLLTLLSDLWRAEEWLVPRGNLLTPASWQAILAGLFLLTFLAWAWFAFIRPPIFGKRNAKRFAETLYEFILRGSKSEMAVIADELSHSAIALVGYATDKRMLAHDPRGGDGNKPFDPSFEEAYANDILLLMADKRFCSSIVESSPITAMVLFQEMGRTKKYGIQVETFSRNIVNEAIANKNSFLYHEKEGYESGLIGHHKPLSQAMFANYQLVDSVGTLLDPHVWTQSKWDADQWEAYCRVVLMTIRDYVDNHFWGHSTVLYRAKGNIENAVSDLYQLNGLAHSWDNDVIRRLWVVVEFIESVIKILDERGVPDYICLRVRESHHPNETFYDHVASMIFEVITHASAVRSPEWECWSIQHNWVWGKLFSLGKLNNPAGRVVKFKLRRLLYNEVSEMERFPNFKGAKILGFCLNVMGLDPSKPGSNKNSRALQKAILSWTKKNFAWLHTYNPQVADACLVDGITYDVENLQLVKTYPAEGLRREPHYVYLEVDPAPEQ